MRSDGSFQGVIGYQEPPDQAVAQLRELLHSQMTPVRRGRS